MKFPMTRRGRDIAAGCVLALALTLGGSEVCLADSPAKVDHSYANGAPLYPDAAQLAGEQGDVLVEVQVTANGYPRRIRVKQTSGFRDLDDAAIETAANWRYVPAVVDGDTATAWTTLKIHYALPAPTAAAAPALLADEHEINDHCTRPAAPAPVNGAAATGADMTSAHDALQKFIQASDRYQTCLRLYIGAQENLTFSVHTTVPAWVYKGIDKKVAENQKDKQDAGDSYNEAVAKFKAKTSH